MVFLFFSSSFTLLLCIRQRAFFIFLLLLFFTFCSLRFCCCCCYCYYFFRSKTTTNITHFLLFGREDSLNKKKQQLWNKNKLFTTFYLCVRVFGYFFVFLMILDRQNIKTKILSIITNTQSWMFKVKVVKFFKDFRYF